MISLPLTNKHQSFFMVVALLITLFLSFYLTGNTIAFAATTVGLSPIVGPSGSNVTVTGAGFASGNFGQIWFDINGDGVCGGSESFTSAVVDGSGAIMGSISIPDVSSGYYMVRIDAPVGGAIEAEALFHVNEPSLVLSATSGKPGQPIIISGRYFAPSKTGFVWFDSNLNYVRDSGEPSMQITSSITGEFNGSISIPAVSPGAYVVRADLPSGGQSEGEAIFTALPGLSITPSSGTQGTVITISGGGFQPSQSGLAWIDINRNGIFETVSESSTPVISDSLGRVITALPVPGSNIAPGSYPVRIELPLGATIKPTANFVLSNAIIALTTRKAIPGGTLVAYGSNFTPNSTGTLWFDANDNGIQDAEEFSRDLVTDRYGKFTANIVVPNATPGVHAIRAVFQGSGSNSAIAKINILTPPDLSFNISNGEPGSTVIIAGSYFGTWTSGRIWLDTNGNGKYEAGEAAKTVKTDGFGKFRTPITIPLKTKAGAYAFCADIPALGRPEAKIYFYVNNVKASKGGGSGPTESGAKLDVISSRPYDDARGVKRMPVITATFNTRIIKGSELASISLSDENGNTVKIRTSLSGRVLTIRLSQMLKSHETYALSIPANAVTDTRGYGMEEKFTITFSTK